MATAFSVLRKRIALLLGDWVEFTTTSAGSTLTAVSTDLASYDNDYFKDQYCLMTSGDDVDVERQVSISTITTGIVTVGRAYGSATGSGKTGEIHRYSNVDYLQALNDALEEGYGHWWWRRMIDTSQVVDNWLINNSFGLAISSDDWTSVGSPTLTYDTTFKMGYGGTITNTGPRSLKMVAGAAAGQVTQAPQINIRELMGKSVTFGMWVYCTAASTARIRLDWGGSSFENHDYHSGTDHWEWQLITVTVPTTATQVKAICETAANGTAYFDEGYLLAGDRRRVQYDNFGATPTLITWDSPRWIAIEEDPHNPDAGFIDWPYCRFEYHEGRSYIVWNHKPPSGHRIQIHSRNRMTAFTSTGTSTTELESPQINLLAQWAAVKLLRMQVGKASGRTRQDFEFMLKQAEKHLDEIKSWPGTRVLQEKVMRFNQHRVI